MFVGVSDKGRMSVAVSGVKDDASSTDKAGKGEDIGETMVPSSEGRGGEGGNAMSSGASGNCSRSIVVGGGCYL